MKKLAISAAILLFLIPGCAAHTSIMPLGEGKKEMSASVGGPFIPVTDPSIPAPYLTAGIDYGISNRINADGHLHLTSLFYKVAGLDFGMTYFPLLDNEYIYALGIQPKLLLFSSLKSDVDSRFRIYPVVSVSGTWKLAGGFIYTGSDFTVPFTRPDYDNEAPHIIVSPFAGYRWDLGKSYNLYTEIKVHGINVKSFDSAVDYISISKYGALSFLFSIGKEL